MQKIKKLDCLLDLSCQSIIRRKSSYMVHVLEKYGII